MSETDSAFDFGMRISTLRHSKGWSRELLGLKIGASKESIYRYESNTQTPPFERVKRLAEVFGVSLDYLVGWENDPSIRLHNLSDVQREALFRFIEAFAGEKTE